MAYELPRTESGEVNWLKVVTSLRIETSPTAFLDTIKAIDANARAGERERCAKICEEKARVTLDFHTASAEAIRNMEDET